MGDLGHNPCHKRDIWENDHVPFGILSHAVGENSRKRDICRDICRDKRDKQPPRHVPLAGQTGHSPVGGVPCVPMRMPCPGSSGRSAKS